MVQELENGRLAQRVKNGQELTRAEALAVLSASDADFPPLFAAAWQLRSHFHGRRVQVQVLSNAKSGLCSEDCGYCSQSCVSSADIARYPLKTVDRLLAEARQAAAVGAQRFCLGLSGRTLSHGEVAGLAAAVAAIKSETGLALCCSLGFLTPDQAAQLRAAGLDRVNHNLNTSERYYPQICTTHTYADRRRTLDICRAAGLELCSGGIVGQGETEADVVDLFLALREVRPEAIPVNFLIPVAGTPFAQRGGQLTPEGCLRVLTLVRLLHPAASIRMAGGREHHLRSLQAMALCVADSLFVGGYLTEPGQGRDAALDMIADAGMVALTEGTEGAF